MIEQKCFIMAFMNMLAFHYIIIASYDPRVGELDPCLNGGLSVGIYKDNFYSTYFRSLQYENEYYQPLIRTEPKKFIVDQENYVYVKGHQH